MRFSNPLDVIGFAKYCILSEVKSVSLANIPVNIQKTVQEVHLGGKYSLQLDLAIVVLIFCITFLAVLIICRYGLYQPVQDNSEL